VLIRVDELPQPALNPLSGDAVAPVDLDVSAANTNANAFWMQLLLPCDDHARQDLARVAPANPLMHLRALAQLHYSARRSNGLDSGSRSAGLTPADFGTWPLWVTYAGAVLGGLVVFMAQVRRYNGDLWQRLLPH
jgi:hypothetical protein